MPSETIIVSQQDDSVDRLAWRFYGRTAGAAEAVLAANRGLAALGPVLPLGTHVVMPAVAEPEATTRLARLWD